MNEDDLDSDRSEFVDGRGGHPGPMLLDLYCRGGATDGEVSSIEKHLLECVTCCRRVYETVRELVRERTARGMAT
jgi:hypothetical protein